MEPRRVNLFRVCFLDHLLHAVHIAIAIAKNVEDSRLVLEVTPSTLLLVLALFVCMSEVLALPRHVQCLLPALCVCVCVCVCVCET